MANTSRPRCIACLIICFAKRTLSMRLILIPLRWRNVERSCQSSRYSHHCSQVLFFLGLSFLLVILPTPLEAAREDLNREKSQA
jgi:hypothetical protein